MMRLSPPLNYRLVQTDGLDITYGGGEANVSASLARMGQPTAHITCFPDNELGHAAVGSFQRYGVDMSHTVFSGARLGLYFLEVGASVRASKIVYDRAGSSFSTLDPAAFNWEKIFQNVAWFHWTGITPAISAEAAEACQQAITTARRMGVTVSADVNYRRNLWQYGKKAQEVMPDLVAGCDVVVCAENDAEDLFSIVPEQGAEDSFTSMSNQLMQRFPNIRQVITTRRETISASHNRLTGVLYNGQSRIETPTYDMNPIIDRIGGGDAFMAGFIYGSLNYTKADEALSCGVAASVLKHTIPGDVNLATVAEVEEVMRGNTSGRLLR